MVMIVVAQTYPVMLPFSIFENIWVAAVTCIRMSSQVWDQINGRLMESKIYGIILSYIFKEAK
jgi:hypothetical protein